MDVECEACNGEGGQWVTNYWITCEVCGGSGVVPFYDEDAIEDDYSEESYP